MKFGRPKRSTVTVACRIFEYFLQKPAPPYVFGCTRKITQRISFLNPGGEDGGRFAQITHILVLFRVSSHEAHVRSSVLVREIVETRGGGDETQFLFGIIMGMRNQQFCFCCRAKTCATKASYSAPPCFCELFLHLVACAL